MATPDVASRQATPPPPPPRRSPSPPPPPPTSDPACGKRVRDGDGDEHEMRKRRVVPQVPPSPSSPTRSTPHTTSDSINNHSRVGEEPSASLQSNTRTNERRCHRPSLWDRPAAPVSSTTTTTTPTSFAAIPNSSSTFTGSNSNASATAPTEALQQAQQRAPPIPSAQCLYTTKEQKRASLWSKKKVETNVKEASVAKWNAQLQKGGGLGDTAREEKFMRLMGAKKKMPPVEHFIQNTRGRVDYAITGTPGIGKTYFPCGSGGSDSGSPVEEEYDPFADAEKEEQRSQKQKGAPQDRMFSDLEGQFSSGMSRRIGYNKTGGLGYDD